ncbi:MAG TPA: hypothetical protein VK045_03135 [Ornithinicoccus sp.]|nr:hypothetical protein [Ornithinicoccus sp.]
MNRALTLWPAAALAAATVLAACGSDDPDQSGTEITAPEQTSDDTEGEDATASDAATSSGDAMGSGPVVATADTELGTILVDGAGMTLYLFTQDSLNTSVCTDDCLVAWPILEGEPTAGEGADDSLLGSFEREDGTIQATYDGWPLYYFAQDQEPGDTTGQAVNDVWWVIDADGAAITGAPGDDDTGGGIDY